MKALEHYLQLQPQAKPPTVQRRSHPHKALCPQVAAAPHATLLAVPEPIVGDDEIGPVLSQPRQAFCGLPVTLAKIKAGRPSPSDTSTKGLD